MKKTFRNSLLALGCLSALAAAGCAGGQEQPTTADYIGIDAAKEAALKAAGLSGSDVTFSSAGLDNQNDTFYYEVNFESGGTEYFYDIDAMTGVVIEEKTETAGAAEPAADVQMAGLADESAAAGSQNGTAAGSQNGAAAGEQNSTAAGGQNGAAAGSQNGAAAGGQNGAAAGAQAGSSLSEADAQSIALSHAGLTEADTLHILAKRDFDDGRQVFDVEIFAADGTEYDYEIALDGTILSYDYDAESTLPRGQAGGSGTLISEDQAIQTVLERVPGASSDNLFLHLDEDGGRMGYEGKLIHDSTEYEFTIDAYSGILIDWESERLR